MDYPIAATRDSPGHCLVFWENGHIQLGYSTQQVWETAFTQAACGRPEIRTACHRHEAD